MSEALKPHGIESFRTRLLVSTLAVAGVVSACAAPLGGKTYREYMLGQIQGTEDLSGGNKRLDKAVIDGDTQREDDELIVNDGVNVRTFPGIEGAVIGKVSAGEKFEDAILTSGDGGDWAAAECNNLPLSEVYYEQLPRDEQGFVDFPEVCFINGDFVQASGK